MAILVPMYQALLTRKYLTSKVMPLLASLAVLLCTTMVLVTWSVMGGFLKTLLASGRVFVGDVTIAWPNTGFAHYEELLKQLQADPAVEAAAPAIEAYGLMGLPDGRTETVKILGIEGSSYDKVTGYFDLLWWHPQTTPLENDVRREDPRLNPDDHELLARTLEQGKTLSRQEPPGGPERAGAVLGIEASGFNRRQPEGYYAPLVRSRRDSSGGEEAVRLFMPANGWITLNILPLDTKGRAIEMVTARLPIANEFKTGLYEFDRRYVLVRLDELQRLLKMNAAKRVARSEGPSDRAFEVQVDPATGEERFAAPDETTLVEEPARVTHMLIRGKGEAAGGDPRREAAKLKIRCEEIYEKFAAKHPGEVPDPGVIFVQTWADINATMIQAVEKETALVLFLFSMISLTAVFLVLAIFWSMVSERTKDVGVLRSLGASRMGVAWLWVRYGMAIGVVGSALGGVAAYLIVLNINPIHEWMGRVTGIQIWDPAVYYFTRIPSEVDPQRAAIVLIAGVLSSTLGALIPAVRAARMDPVRALRFE
jgi:lipoprotein-releasing system permease protein